MSAGERAITPPVFVQYDGRGIIAFETTSDAVVGASDKHAHRITAAWDAAGQSLSVDHEGRPYLTIAPTGTADRERLRDQLIGLQQPVCFTDLSTMSYEDLVGFSYQRLRLRSRSELLTERSAGCSGCSWPFG